MTVLEQIIEQLDTAEHTARMREDDESVKVLRTVREVAAEVLAGATPMLLLQRVLESAIRQTSSDHVLRVLTDIEGRIAGPHAIRDE